ncbi:MAG: dihydroneopterin aldolase [Bacteroidia bacterium]
MAEIALLGLEFKGYHGLYPEEKIQGNRFVLDLIARSPHSNQGDQAPTAPFALGKALLLGKSWPDYARMQELAETVYSQPRDLLEEVVMDILKVFKNEWPEWTFEVALTKTNPPIVLAEGSQTLRIPASRVTLRCSDL